MQGTDRSANLKQVILALVQLLNLIAHQDKRPKLRLVVAEVDAFRILPIAEQGVRPRHRDVIDSDLALVAPAHRKLIVLLRESHHVDRPAGVFLEGQRLHHYVVLRVCWSFDIDELVDSVGRLEQVRVGVLAELALKITPEQRRDLWGLLALHLEAKPVLEAEIVDEADRARAVARHDARVLFRTLSAPAEPTLAACAACAICLLLLGVSWALLIAILIDVWLEEGHLVGLFKVLLVNLILIVLLVSTYKLLDPKLHPAKLDYVKFVDFSTLYHS